MFYKFIKNEWEAGRVSLGVPPANIQGQKVTVHPAKMLPSLLSSFLTFDECKKLGELSIKKYQNENDAIK